MNSNYVIGIDYGTDSVRCLVVNAQTGQEIATDVFYYPRWKKGKFSNPKKNQFRHHPLDYLEGLETTIKSCLNKVPSDVIDNIKGIAVDTTGSTPCLVTKKAEPLALLEEFQDNPNGMFILWKDHTAVKEADLINQTAKSWGGVDYTKYEGGVYSSEWFWAKILHVLREDKNIRQKAYSAIELCDWVPAILTGTKNIHQVKRSRCAAGHKAMWHESWEGLPSEDFLSTIDPLLKGFRKRLYTETYTVDKNVGYLCDEWMLKLGLPKNLIVGVGAFDAHMGAIGANIKPFSLVKIMGTSTCDIVVVPKSKIENKLIKGICGQVDGSVIPGMIGLEAGQSSFGDVYAWYSSLLTWSIENLMQKLANDKNKDISDLIKTTKDMMITELSKKAESIPIDESGIIALDWFNGRRTPNANQLLKAAIMNLNLASGGPAIFRSLVEATAYGARKINDCFESQGIPIKEIIGIGGVSKKSSFVMQILADVLNRQIKVCESEQACALGAAICAATAANIYNSIKDAQNNMASAFSTIYIPNSINADKYNSLYESYKRLGTFVEQHIDENKDKYINK
ncbi:MAG: ribulokinase [Candidatus Lokiarchaeota archaeon]|nr:ribulokinase [Candidatus Lokiarchaeota archaeon]